MTPKTALVAAAAAALIAGWWQGRAPGGEPPLAWDAAVPAAAGAPARSGSVVVAWFYNSRERTLEPVALRLPEVAPVADRARAAFSALCEEPPEEARRVGGLTSAVGRCRVAEAWVDGATLHVRFDPAAAPAPVGIAADQLEMTAHQFPGVGALQLWAGGVRLGRPLPVDGQPAHSRLAPRP